MFLSFVNNSLLVAAISAILHVLHAFLEKLVFKRKGGDINKYYLIRNFIVAVGFMIFIIVITYANVDWND